jgi:hypothetical protein
MERHVIRADLFDCIVRLFLTLGFWISIHNTAFSYFLSTTQQYAARTAEDRADSAINWTDNKVTSTA